jgi:hypothetical protein
MREAAIMIMIFALVGFYLVDKYQYNGHYGNLVWTQSNADVQKFQDQLRRWWRD